MNVVFGAHVQSSLEGQHPFLVFPGHSYLSWRDVSHPTSRLFNTAWVSRAATHNPDCKVPERAHLPGLSDRRAARMIGASY